MFLPKCPKCLRCGCECGKLPYTIEVATSLSNKSGVRLSAPYPILSYGCGVFVGAVSSPDKIACFGSGFTGEVELPGGCRGFLSTGSDYCNGTTDNRGPVQSVKVLYPGECFAKYGRKEPVIVAYSAPSGDFEERESATFTVSLELVDHILCPPETTFGLKSGSPLGPQGGVAAWRISGITVSGGKGYLHPAQPIRFSLQSPTGIDVVVQEPVGWFVKSTVAGKPTHVEQAFPDSPNGTFYNEDRTLEPYVAEVPMYVSECIGNNDAVLEGVVDEDPQSESFGRIIDVTIVNGGSQYFAWKWAYVCQKRQSTVVYRAANPHRLVTVGLDACYGSGFCAEVVPHGERVQPALVVAKELLAGCGATFTPVFAQGVDDNGEKIWSVASIGVAGGSGYNVAVLTLRQKEASSLCNLEVMEGIYAVLNTAAGVPTGVTVFDGGKLYTQLDYDGMPSPIRKIQVVSSGGGYAKFGRREPVLRVYIKAPGDFRLYQPWDVKIKQGLDECGLKYWEVEYITKWAGTTNLPERVQLFIDWRNSPPPLAPAEEIEEVAAVIWLLADEDGNAVAVEIDNGGRYYVTDPNLAPTVASFVPSVTQLHPSAGAGAAFDVVIETDTASEAFGTVKSIAITSGGSGYMPAGSPKDCLYQGPCGGGLVFNRDNEAENVSPRPLLLSVDNTFGSPSSGPIVGKTTGDKEGGEASCDEVSQDLSTVHIGFFESSPTVTLESNGPKAYRPCKQGADQGVDCGFCPEFYDLCITMTFTDWQGNTETLSGECDITYGKSSASGASTFMGPLNGYYSASVVCEHGRITITAGGGPGAGYPEECGACTGSGGSVVVECTESPTWYAVTRTINFEFSDPWCAGCPPIGSVTVTIANGPC